MSPTMGSASPPTCWATSSSPSPRRTTASTEATAGSGWGSPPPNGAAQEGQEGVAKARSFKPDVVLCDIGLPGLDGYGVARQIRADPSISPTLIALTGYARPEDQRESFKAGFDHHLAKPIQIPELEQVLATATAPLTSRRILVVDDNDALRSNIRGPL